MSLQLQHTAFVLVPRCVSLNRMVEAERHQLHPSFYRRNCVLGRNGVALLGPWVPEQVGEERFLRIFSVRFYHPFCSDRLIASFSFGWQSLFPCWGRLLSKTFNRGCETSSGSIAQCLCTPEPLFHILSQMLVKTNKTKQTNKV